MTIINHANDGLYPELIVLFRTVAYSGKIDRDDLIGLCYPDVGSNADNFTRLRGALARWTSLGLFVEKEGTIQLDNRFMKERKESLDDFTTRLPSFCRRLILEETNSLPLWGESVAVASDFVRGISWLLAQNIYMFPTTWNAGAEGILHEQVVGGKTIIQNDTRWSGLRFWARYLGFASGESGAFQIDPTLAIKDELPFIFESKNALPATEFLNELSLRLPVLDNGIYRKEVESYLSETTWRKPIEGHLSMSLSLALKRLDFSNTIQLQGKADAGSSFRLIGRNYRSWSGFEYVKWNGGEA